MNVQAAWLAQWGEMRTQWQASARLRLGVWAVAGILLGYGVLKGLDQVDLNREEVRQLDAELVRLRVLAKETEWPERAKNAEALNAALASMAWGEADLGLTEAALQDWLRSLSNRLNLKTRELTVVRVEDGSKGPTRAAASTNMPTLPPGHVLLRARISFDLQRGPLMTFLAECARSERSVVIERLVLRHTSQPPVAEIDLRVLARTGQVSP